MEQHSSWDLMLGVLCEASTIMNPKVLIFLILGMIALLLSGIGGIIGGYLVYFINGKNFNPTVGIAGVSCVPSTAKIAHHEVAAINKRVDDSELRNGRKYLRCYNNSYSYRSLCHDGAIAVK